MSVTVSGGIIVLAGACAADDAESLLIALQDHPDAVVDVAGLTRLHLAVVQVLVSSRPRVEGASAASAQLGKIVTKMLFADAIGSHLV